MDVKKLHNHFLRYIFLPLVFSSFQYIHSAGIIHRVSMGGKKTFVVCFAFKKKIFLIVILFLGPKTW